MTNLLFLSGTYSEHPIEDCEQQPLLVDDLRSVSATMIQPGTVKEEFLKHYHWVLVSQDDWEDMSVTLTNLVFRNPANICMFGFDMLPLIRRINGSLAKRGLMPIPAILWSGATSRAYDIVRYLTADNLTTPVEVLRYLGIKCLPVYQPHRDAQQDQVYLLELASRYGIINERINIAEMLGPIKIPAPPSIAEPEQQEQKKSGRVKPPKQLQ